jgi:hypothetical protein
VTASQKFMNPENFGTISKIADKEWITQAAPFNQSVLTLPQIFELDAAQFLSTIHSTSAFPKHQNAANAVLQLQLINAQFYHYYQGIGWEITSTQAKRLWAEQHFIDGLFQD